jgi:hypothetical protein
MILIENRDLLLNQFNNNIIIAEIGVFKGEFSKKIFESLTPSELHLIDIFEGNTCSGDKDGNNIVWTNLSDEYSSLKELYKNEKNVFIHKGNSFDVLSSFDNEYFDLIYIDGDHRYLGVKKDLEVSYSKVKTNGFICGHDYTTSMFVDVVNAVNEFCNEKSLSIEFLTKDGCPSFCIRKK